VVLKGCSLSIFDTNWYGFIKFNWSNSVDERPCCPMVHGKIIGHPAQVRNPKGGQRLRPRFLLCWSKEAVTPIKPGVTRRIQSSTAYHIPVWMKAQLVPDNFQILAKSDEMQWPLRLAKNKKNRRWWIS